MLGTDLSKLVRDLSEAVGIGEVQRVQAPVVGFAPPFQDPALLEDVDERDEPAWWGAQQPGQGLLGLPRTRRDGAEQPGLRRHEIQLGDPFGELRRGVRPELGKQERSTRPLAVAQGYLAASASPSDARRRTVGLTDAGLALLDAAHTWQESTFAALTQDWTPGERAEFHRAMSRLISRSADLAGDRSTIVCDT